MELSIDYLLVPVPMTLSMGVATALVMSLGWVRQTHTCQAEQVENTDHLLSHLFQGVSRAVVVRSGQLQRLPTVHAAPCENQNK